MPCCACATKCMRHDSCMLAPKHLLKMRCGTWQCGAISGKFLGTLALLLVFFLDLD